MANAIRKITIERGEDVRDFVLCSFGGAAGQHACRVADALDVTQVWFHPLAGVLSAYGMGLADIRVERQLSVDQPFDDNTMQELPAKVAALTASCDAALAEQQVPEGNRRYAVFVGMRVAGADTVIDVTHDADDAMLEEFGRRYRRRFGADPESDTLVVATLRVEGTGVELSFEESPLEDQTLAEAAGNVPMWVDGCWETVAIYHWSSLGSGQRIDGPAIIADSNSTIVVDAGWTGELQKHGQLLLKRSTGKDHDDVQDDTRPDPVRLEIFNRLFMHIAEQMGTVLQHTALSVNIRERLDFSCALFDDQGRLVSNAPHMPVHLGSMGESVRSVIEARGDRLNPGDAIMLNSPYHGGTHLPDITVVTPWFADAERPQFYLASRAHHADIGGITPGSMPSDSRHIDDEGVLLDNVLLVDGGRLLLDEALALLSGAKHPARNPQQNIADLKAQLAANQQGIRQLEKAVQRYSIDTVRSYLRFVRENAAISVRRLLGTLHDGEFRYALDSGERIAAKLTVDAEAGRPRSISAERRRNRRRISMRRKP